MGAIAVESPPAFLATGDYGAEQTRRAIGSLISGTGVVGDNDLQVVPTSPVSMNLNVGTGQAWLPGTLGGASVLPVNVGAQTTFGSPANFTSQGNYYGYQPDAALTDYVTISAADPTNPRIDLVVASVADAFYSGSSNDWVVQVITGTAAADPVAPAPPANTIVLAEVAVAAEATSITSGDITDQRPKLALYPNRTLYMAEVYESGEWVIAAGNHSMTLGTVAYDPLNLTSGDTFTCPVNGVYLVTAGATFLPAVGHNYQLQLGVNNILARSFPFTFAYSTAQVTTGGMVTYPCEAGQVLNISFNNSDYDGVMTGVGGQPYTWVSFTLLTLT